jgi:hypothetical protein
MSRVVLIAVIFFAGVFSSWAADGDEQSLLPAAFGSAWVMDGKAGTYTALTLHTYINGEAEIYLPYGFERAVTAIYVKPGSKGGGIVVNIFEMGSLLDAFGIYGNFRSPTLRQIEIGAEGFLDEAQLMFYQDRYFVRIETSGAVEQAAPQLLACAQAVSRNLPGNKERPAQPALLRTSGIVPLTERYYPTGLLGYDFLGKGLTAEVLLKGGQVKSFVALTGSEGAAKKAFDEYVRYLKTSGTVDLPDKAKGGIVRAVDPLYKTMVFQQSGLYVFGVTGLKDPRDGDALMAELAGRLTRQR